MAPTEPRGRKIGGEPSVGGRRLTLVSHTRPETMGHVHDAVPSSMIRARGLRKSFGDFEAVRGIDLDVRPGESFGFLGPNGAGKSSTMRMVAAVSRPSGGELSVLGMDPAVDGPRIRARLGR